MSIESEIEAQIRRDTLANSPVGAQAVAEGQVPMTNQQLLGVLVAKAGALEMAVLRLATEIDALSR